MGWRVGSGGRYRGQRGWDARLAPTLHVALPPARVPQSCQAGAGFSGPFLWVPSPHLTVWSPWGRARAGMSQGRSEHPARCGKVGCALRHPRAAWGRVPKSLSWPCAPLLQPTVHPPSLLATEISGPGCVLTFVSLDSGWRLHLWAKGLARCADAGSPVQVWASTGLLSLHIIQNTTPGP